MLSFHGSDLMENENIQPVSRIIIIFAFSLWSVGICSAQSPYFQQYFLLNKNEPVHVNKIYQDDTGIIWYGTNKGLFEFDGIRYVRITEADGLPDNNVTAIGQDSLGQIWTGHKNGSIAFLNKGKVTKFSPEEGTSTAPVSDIVFTQDGTLWFSTLNDGLYYYKNMRLFRLDENEGMPDLFVYDITSDSLGNIWAGTDGGAVICSIQGNQTKISVLNTSSGMPDNIIKKIQITHDGLALMSTEDKGMTIYNPKSKSFSPMLAEDWPFGTVTDFIVGKNQVWLSANQTGLIVFNLKSKILKTYSGEGNALKSVTSLYKDKEGNVWIGSKTGVLRAHGDEVELFDNVAEISGKSILALTSDKNGKVWFSTRDGLFTYAKDRYGNGMVEKKDLNPSIRKSVIISLYCDEGGSIWGGLFGEGVLRINPTSGKVTHLNKELRNGNVLNITGRHDVVWLATLGGGTKITYQGDDLKIDNYGSEEGLISDYVYQVFIDSKERIWFATDGKGADMLDEKGFHHFQDGLPSKVVYGFTEDGTGTIWANVQSNGLYRFNNGKFEPLPPSIKLRDNNVISLSSNEGALVVMHESGVDVYNPVANYIRHLGDEAGLRDRKPNLNAVTKGLDGTLYFGTEAGMVSYASNDNEVLTTPMPILRELKIFDQVTEIVPNADFSYGQNNLTIGYQGIWYENPENLNYRYRLDNYDLDWISTRNNDVTYSKLPPGVYTFRLQVADGDSFHGAREATFSFTIEPPFWRTIPFYFFAAAMVLVAAYLLVTYRERKLRRDKMILEAKVNARTEEIRRKNLEIQAQNDEILTQNEEIQAQAEEIKGINENLEQLVQHRTAEVVKKSQALEEYAFINAHKLRAPVASVLGLINLLAKTELNEEAKEINDHLKRSAEQLDSIVYTITKTIEKGIDDKVPHSEGQRD